MKPLNIVTLILVIVGGLNWGLVGLFNYNLVQAIFGDRLDNAIYVIVGLCALYQLFPWSQAISTDEVDAEANVIRRNPRV